jgi:hypothetical protein
LSRQVVRSGARLRIQQQAMTPARGGKAAVDRDDTTDRIIIRVA